LVRCFEIFDHQVKWRLARSRACTGRKNQMRASAKLEHGHFRPMNHGAHPDRPHELLCFRQSIRLEDDMTNPDKRAEVFAGHGYSRSSTIATPIPPAAQTVTSPYC